MKKHNKNSDLIKVEVFCILTILFLNRRDRIRTCDFYVPNVALYQTEPHLVDF